MKKLIICSALVLALSACTFGGNVGVGGSSNGVGASFGLGTGIRF